MNSAPEFKPSAVETALAGVTMAAERLPERPGSDFKDAVHWRVTITRDGRGYTTEYSEGIGHFINSFVKRSCVVQRYFLAGTRTERDKVRHDFCLMDNEIHASLKKERVSMRDRAFVVKPPKLADVFFSLVSDAGCGIADTFEEFCGELGYDPESRKAEGLYRACKDVALALVRLGFDLPTLQEAFQDY